MYGSAGEDELVWEDTLVGDVVRIQVGFSVLQTFSPPMGEDAGYLSCGRNCGQLDHMQRNPNSTQFHPKVLLQPGQ